jgi:hypothetical protein
VPSAYTSGYRPFDFADFSGGLNLRDKSDAVGDKEAIDLLNVTFTERGAIRQREGYSDLTPADLTNRVDSMAAHYTTAGARQLMLGAGTRIDVANQVGAGVGAVAGLSGGPWNFAQFGDPTRELVYCGNGLDPLVRWDGAGFALGTGLATVNGVGAAMPKAGAIAVTGSTPGASSGTNASNRLVATAYGTQTTGGPGGTQSTPSRVHFSNAGQPEVWETDGDPGIPGTRAPRGRNFIDLTPGDGEYITASVTWKELVFIFKQTKFFVLWGEGQGADGTPTFQVREVVNSVGLASAQAVTVGRDGVYFMNRRGVYRTTGENPVLLSDIVSPMWMQDPDPYFRSLPINLAALDRARALWMMERFYLAVPTGSATENDRLLVYDTQHNWWSLYDVPASALAMFRSGSLPELHFGYAGPTLPARVGHLVLGATNDRGAVISSRWRSGWSDYGTTEVKTIRESKLWGTGNVVVSFSTDFYRNFRTATDARFGPAGSSWTYGELTARGGLYSTLASDFTTYAALTAKTTATSIIEDAMVRVAMRGMVFSTQFANSPNSPSWALHRVSRHLREVRAPSVSVAL